MVDDTLTAVRLDGTDRLCQAVYGRKSLPRDYIGGSSARMLHDAAALIEALADRASSPALKADCAQLLPGGKLDDTTYEAIESALDKAEVPMRAVTGGWLTLAERVAVLALRAGKSPVKDAKHG